MPEVRLAIISDLHAFVEDPNLEDPKPQRRPSHLSVTAAGGVVEDHPIQALLKLLEKDSRVRADALLCPGDLGDKASPQGIQYAWTCLQRLKEALGCSLLATTTGNHDLDSRHVYNRYSSDAYLKTISPPYPFPDELLNNEYWARHFVLLEDPHFRLLVLNSSAHHGEVDPEKNHGRVLTEDISRMKGRLESLSKADINILLCHHHPQPHSELKLGSADTIQEGQLLLDMLGGGQFGAWLVVHGHKHHPKISYAAGSATSPVVFSAGSLCAELYLELQTAARNQFHIITLRAPQIVSNGMVGTIKSWSWKFGSGWIPAPAGENLPYRCGFGYRGSMTGLAQRVAQAVKRIKIKWPVLESAVPDVNYLTPQDFYTLKRLLMTDHDLEIVSDDEGVPKEIGRK